MLTTGHNRHLVAHLLFSRTERRLDRRSEYGLVRTTSFLNTHRRTHPPSSARDGPSHNRNQNKSFQHLQEPENEKNITPRPPP